MSLSESEVLEILRSGEKDAQDLLDEANPRYRRRFQSICRSLSKLMEDIKGDFDDAQYYSANGTVCLMLGSTHTGHELTPQQELIADSINVGILDIGGGDW